MKKKDENSKENYLNKASAKEAIDTLNTFSKELKKINKVYEKKLKKLDTDKE